MGWALLFIATVAIALFLSRKRVKHLSLSDYLVPPDADFEIQLRFVKVNGRYDQYEVQFWNPLKGEWWTLPDRDAAIHQPWALERKGSYGAYDLYTMQVPEGSIEFVKMRYKTLGNVQSYFDELNRRFRIYQERQRAEEQKPRIIY